MVNIDQINEAKKRLKLTKEKGPWAVALTDVLNKIIDEVKRKAERGEKGEKGDLGDKGDSIIGPKGDIGPQGPPGAPGLSIKGDKGEMGIVGRPGKDGKPGAKGERGPIGRPGKDGSPDKPQDIKKKLETLKGEDRLDAKAIKNLPEIVRELPTLSLFGGQSGGGGQVKDVVAGSNIIVEKTDSGKYIISSTASGGTGVIQMRWIGNGPYRTGTGVDGAFISDTAFTITNIWLWQGTGGSSGNTIIDLNINGITAYTTQANRPTIAFNDADNKVDCTLPDIISVAAGDILTIDIDAVQAGTPLDIMLIIEGA